VAEKVYLHIGAMKSGTSFIQATLAANQPALAAQGVLFPGERWRDQVRGVIDALGQKRDGRKPKRTRGAWKRITDEIEAWRGTAVVSMEFLGPAPRARIDRLLESLAPAEVHVIITVRDLGRNIPAMWQEEIQNAATWTWPEFLRLVRSGASRRGRAKGNGRRFWRHQDTPAIARRWADAVGKERFTVVTVPHPGAPPALLWERFCSVVGIDASSCELAPRSNPSLGAASTLLVRALNVRLAQDGALPNPAYNRFVKHRLAKQGLSRRKAEEPTIGFDKRWVRRLSDRMIAEFEELDVRVVGDLHELDPVVVKGVRPDRISDREQLAAAVDGLAHLIRRWSRN
jgi:hypothetical protein